MNQMRVLVIIPAYNEQDSILSTVNSLKAALPAIPYQVDYIIVNDGSKDNTLQVLMENRLSYINLPANLGLSGAIQAGMLYAEQNGYHYAIQLDGDGQHDPKYISDMLKKMEEQGADIVIGSRFCNEKKPKSMRMLGSNLIAASIHITTGKRILDTTSGMRLFNQKMIHVFANEMNFDPEPDTLAYLLRHGAKIEEIQVEMQERTAGTSYLNWLNSIKYMIRILSSILLFQWFRKAKLPKGGAEICQ